MNTTKKLILVVDDTPAILEMMELILNHAGYDVATSVDGDTLKKIPERKPDLILLDIMMPEISGIEISQKLKADPTTSHIPIILMSASTERLAKQTTHVEGFLSKPFEINQMLHTIQKYI